MLKVLLNLLLSLFIGSFLFSCAPYSADNESELPDLPPPPDYKPVFFSKVIPASKDNITSSAPIISRIDPHGDKVRAYVHLFDNNGNYLSGADSKELSKIWCKGTLLTDNIEVPVENLTIREGTAKDRAKLSLSLVMDHSGSMGEDRAFACQEAAKSFFGNKKNEDMISFIKYDGRISLESQSTTDKNTLINNLQINGLSGFGGITAVNDAILTAINDLQKTGNQFQKVIIVFTDGYDNASLNSQDFVINRAIETNTIICPIDFGYGINEGYMEKYAKETGGIYHRIYQKHEFEKAFNDIYKKFEYFYIVEFEQPEYSYHKFKLQICLPDTQVTAEKDFNNIPDIGTINLLNVYFDTDKSDIKKGSEKALAKVMKLLKLYPDMNIELRGHTDNSNKTGDPDHNKKLSERRANSVKQELIKLGFPESQILAFGFGDTIPVADNSTNEGKAKNRRTEFIVKSR